MASLRSTCALHLERMSTGARRSRFLSRLCARLVHTDVRALRCPRQPPAAPCPWPACAAPRSAAPACAASRRGFYTQPPPHNEIVNPEESTFLKRKPRPATGNKASQSTLPSDQDETYKKLSHYKDQFGENFEFNPQFDDLEDQFDAGEDATALDPLEAKLRAQSDMPPPQEDPVYKAAFDSAGLGDPAGELTLRQLPWVQELEEILEAATREPHLTTITHMRYRLFPENDPAAFEPINDDPIVVDANSVSDTELFHLVKGCGANVARASTLLDSFLMTGGTPTSTLLYAMLTVCAQAKEMESAEKVFEFLTKEYGVEANTRCYALLMRAHLHHRKYDAALRTFETVPQELRSGNVVLYGFAMTAYALQSDVSSCVRLLSELRAQGSGNTMAWTALFRSLENSSTASGLLATARAMLADGVRPDHVTLTCIARGLAASGHPAAALRIARLLHRHGFRARPHLYYTLAQAFSRLPRSRLHMQHLLSMLKELRLPVSPFLLGRIALTVTLDGDAAFARDTLIVLLRHGGRPSPLHLLAVVASCATHTSPTSFDMAQLVLEYMEANRYELNGILLNKVLQLYNYPKDGKWSAADVNARMLQLLRLVLRLGTRPSSRVLALALAHCLERGDVPTALSLVGAGWERGIIISHSHFSPFVLHAERLDSATARTVYSALAPFGFVLGRFHRERTLLDQVARGDTAHGVLALHELCAGGAAPDVDVAVTVLRALQTHDPRNPMLFGYATAVFEALRALPRCPAGVYVAYSQLCLAAGDRERASVVLLEMRRARMLPLPRALDIPLPPGNDAELFEQLEEI